MQDQVKTFEIFSPKIKLPKHGYTKIELKDPYTCHKQVYEDENMITNAIEKYFSNGGLLNYFNSGLIESSMYTQLFGGILLFDNTLQESANNFSIPAGVSMTANMSAGVVNNSNPPELGSYAANESGIVGNAYVQVYDFSTGQGNGDIACACLTSQQYGYIGFGNNSRTEKKSNNYNTTNSSAMFGDYKGWSPIDTSIVFKVDADGYMYSVPMSALNDTTHDVIVEKHLSTLGDINIFNRGSKVAEYNVGSDYMCSLNNSVAKYRCCNGKLYQLRHNNQKWTNDNPIVVTEIDETGLNIYRLTPPEADIYASPAYIDCWIHNGCAFIPKMTGASTVDATNTVYKIRLSDSGLVSAITFTGAWDSMWRTTSAILADGVWVNGSRIIDFRNGTCLNHNADNYTATGDYEGRFDVLQQGNPLFCFTMYNTGGVNGYYRLKRRYNYIASINNLDSTVTKTPDKTMKVTYRITF